MKNALIKAKFISDALEVPAIGDDSGLEVDILNGEPGIYSARYADSGQDRDNCLKLLENLKAIKDPQRTARFKCCLVGFYKGKIIKSFGSLDGEISQVICYISHHLTQKAILQLPHQAQTRAL